MADEQREAIQQMLEAHNTISLATSRDGKPWAASVFFASDKNLNLFFVSDDHTHHARDIGNGSAVVATANVDCAQWSDVKGLQISGFAEPITGMERVGALQHYLLKFPDVKALFETPRGKDEETIARRLKSATLYRVKPRWIRLIDNSQWFGYKLELDLEQD